MKGLKLERLCRINYEDFPLVFDCTIFFENRGKEKIENLVYNEKLNFDGLNINLKEKEQDPILRVERIKKGTTTISGMLDTLDPGEKKELKYSLFIDRINRGGTYPITAFVNALYNGETISTYDYTKLSIEEVTAELRGYKKGSYEGGFKVTINADKHTCESELLLKGYITVDKTLTLEMGDFVGFTIIDGNTGKIINPGDEVTNTVIELSRKMIVQKCTNNIFRVNFKIVRIEDIAKEKGIPFLLLSPQLMNKEVCYLCRGQNRLEDIIKI